MKNTIKILFVSVMFTLYGCEDFFSTTVPLDPPERIPQLAVSAFWNNSDTLLTVFVDGTSDIFSGRTFFNDTLGLPDATVELFADGQLVGTFDPIPNDGQVDFFTSEGSYGLLLNEPLENKGNEFELKVSHPDFPTATAKQTMPARVVPTEFEFLANGGTDQYGYATQGVEVKFQDPSGESNFYEIGTFYKDSFELDPFGGVQYYFNGSDNSSLDPNATTGPNYTNLFVNDTGFDGQNYNLLVQLLSFGDTSNELVVLFNSITEARYRFATSLRAYNDSGDFGPFSEPVPLYTNVENGLGTFGLGRIHVEEIQL